jgi:hypothetical protein
VTIVQGLTTSFKTELLSAVHNFTSHTFKIALYTSAAALDATTTVYSATNEASGTGYVAGGTVITPTTPLAANGIAYVNFSNAAWPNSSISAFGALIYNVTAGNKSVAVLSFGATKTSNLNAFLVSFPANTYTTALIRIT